MLWGICASALCCPSAPRLSCTELLTHFFIHAVYFRLLEEEEEVSKALSSALTPKVHFYSKNTRLTTNIKPGYDRIKREQPCSANERGAGVKTERPRESHRWYTQVVRHFQSCRAEPGYSEQGGVQRIGNCQVLLRLYQAGAASVVWHPRSPDLIQTIESQSHL